MKHLFRKPRVIIDTFYGISILPTIAVDDDEIATTFYFLWLCFQFDVVFKK